MTELADPGYRGGSQGPIGHWFSLEATTGTDPIADIAFRNDAVSLVAVKKRHLLVTLMFELVVVVVTSILVAAVYWLKARYFPGPTIVILGVGILAASAMGWLVARPPDRPQGDTEVHMVSVVSGVCAGVATMVLSTAIMISFLGS